MVMVGSGRLLGFDGSIVLFLGLPVLLVYAGVRIRAGMSWRRAAFEFAAGGYVLLAISMLFFPLEFGEFRQRNLEFSGTRWINLVPMRSIAGTLAVPYKDWVVQQIGGNLALLLPFGIVAPALLPRLRKLSALALAALATAVGIEVLQYVLRITGLGRRAVDIDDVMMNVSGALIGYAVWMVVMAAVARRNSAREVALLEAVVLSNNGIEQDATR